MYLGNIPSTSFEAVKKDRFTGLTGTGVTLSHSVSSVQDIVCWVNNVKQDYNNYTVSNTALTLGGSLVSADVVQVLYVGRTFQTVNPPNASVGSAQIADDLISGKTALGATPADTDELLISDAGTLKRVDFSHLKSANTPAFSATRTSNQSAGSANAVTKFQGDIENFDTDSAFASNVFTVPSGKGGKYYLFAQAGRQVWDSDRFLTRIVRTPSGGSGDEIAVGETHDGEGYETTQVECIFQLTAGDVIKIQVWHNSGSTRNISSGVRTVFQGYKIIE